MVSARKSFEKERILLTGKEFKFETDLILQPIYGRYIRLNLTSSPDMTATFDLTMDRNFC